MLCNTHTKTQCDPFANERERVMGFWIGTTTNPGLYEGQRQFVLGQTMDLKTLV